MREFFDIFSVFFKIGALTFGGGYTMLPLLKTDIARRRKWASDEEIIDYYAMSQSLPGIVAVNTAMLIGYRRGGVSGLFAACLGMTAPSLIIILAIALFIKNFLAHEAVIHAFSGVRVAVAALVTKTVFEMGAKSVTDKACAAIFLVSLAASVYADISPVIPVVAGAACGVALKRGAAAK